MQNENQRLHPLTLFLRFFKVGVIGFGGGSALIPVIEQELVGDGKPMSEVDYLKHTVIANITPGALPVKLGATCGYQLGGPLGSLAGAYGAMIPGVFITVLIMALFSLMGEQAITLFNYASIGISVFIVMLLMNYTLKTCGQGQTSVNWTLCAISFLLTCGKEVRQIMSQILEISYNSMSAPLFDISTIDLMIVTFLIIIILCVKPSKQEFAAASLLSVAYCFGKGKLSNQLGMGFVSNGALVLFLCFLTVKLLSPRSKGASSSSGAGRFSKSAVICIALFLAIPLVWTIVLIPLFGSTCISFLGNIGLSTVTSFGGGEAYVSVADGFFVQSGYIGADSYYTKLVPVANALPGPILVKIASGIGFLFGSERFSSAAGWLIAATSAALATGACCTLALAVLQMYEAVEHSAFITNLKRYILPVICGMLLSTSCSMLYEASKITSSKGIPALPVLAVMALWVGALRWLHKRFHIHDLILLLGSAAVSLAGLMIL